MAMCALALMTGPSVAGAAGIEPVEGAWKGKTRQGYSVYFGVSAGGVVNVRFTYREVICGKSSVHERTSRLEIDEAGHFSSSLGPHLEFEGTFVAPNRVNGKIIYLGTEFAPHCMRKVVGFTAYPR